MKKIIASFLFILLFQLTEANDQKKVKPSLKQVTVFLNRAQINSAATAYIEAGTTDIILEGLPPYIDPQSIQVSGKGDFIIMSVKHSLNYVDPQKKSQEVIVLEDSIDRIQLELDIIRSLREVYMKEEQMILTNQSIRGEQNGVSPESLEEMADFFRDRLTEIRTELLTSSRKEKKVMERLQKYQNQLASLNKILNQPTAQIVVTVSTKAAKNAVLDIDYIVANAGWYPLYDLRAKDTKSPVQLSYKAQVYQNTGIDWKNVKLKLSTANPSLGGTKPQLYTWYLDIYDPVTYGYDKKPKAGRYYAPSVVDEEVMPMKSMDMKMEEPNAEGVSNYTVVTETTLAAEFDIAIPYSVESGGEGQLVDVQNYDLPATYKHSAVPKMDKDAFLMALVTGWEELNLLSGNANIYFEGTYVGQSFLDIQNTSDTLALSLGRDSKVIIERKTVKDFTKKNTIGTNKKDEYAYEIIVRNTKKDAIEITLEDQIPVTKNSQIEVEVIDNGGAEYDATTGKLTWKLKLNSAETKSVIFKYSVKYPKNKTVSGL
ncbi:MAG: DUF4139 domain-containing protein [Cytophagaceae bacterium]|nr:DUF4139 domain-containing protein [Cytophagaceae bacterium]